MANVTPIAIKIIPIIILSVVPLFNKKIPPRTKAIPIPMLH